MAWLGQPANHHVQLLFFEPDRQLVAALFDQFDD
jgi:hypothetical protein